MTGQMWPRRCPLDDTLLEVEASPLGGGLKVRRCPVVTCDFVTPSYKPERPRTPRRERRARVGAGRSTWARNEHWKDRDER